MNRATGVIAGYLLRQVRVGINLTQEQLAERLEVDLNTVRSWETGRRPLGQVKVATLQAVLRKLRRLGGAPHLLDRFNTAVEVDLFIQEVLAGGMSPGEHAAWFSSSDWDEMLGWALTGPQPRLSKVDRVRVAEWLASSRAPVLV